jgi:hypothetical protein
LGGLRPAPRPMALGCEGRESMAKSPGRGKRTELPSLLNNYTDIVRNDQAGGRWWESNFNV